MVLLKHSLWMLKYREVFMVKLILLLLIFSQIAKGQSLESCIEQGNDFTPQRLVEESCYNVFLREGPKKAVWNSEQESLKVIAYKNMIFSKKNKKGEEELSIISGKKSGLKNIVDFDVNLNQKRIAVLNESLESSGTKAVYIFKLGRHGNVVPSNVIESKEIQTAQKLRFSPDGEHIYVSSNEKNNILKFSSEGDSRSAQQAKKPYPIQRFGDSGPTLQTPENFIATNERVIIYNQNAGKIYIYPTFGFRPSPTWEFDARKEIEGRKPASFDVENEVLVIKDGDGKKHEFPFPEEKNENPDTGKESLGADHFESK